MAVAGHEAFADDFAFSVPRGAHLVPSNPKLHFSSVLVKHLATRTLHVDDTILYVRPPALLRPFFGREVTRLHPTLAKVLEARPGAADEFGAWTEELLALCADVSNLCAAHGGSLTAERNDGPSVRERVERAVREADGIVKAHRAKHG